MGETFKKNSRLIFSPPLYIVFFKVTLKVCFFNIKGTKRKVKISQMALIIILKIIIYAHKKYKEKEVSLLSSM